MYYFLRVIDRHNKHHKFTFLDKESLIAAIKVFNESKDFEITSYTNFNN